MSRVSSSLPATLFCAAAVYVLSSGLSAIPGETERQTSSAGSRTYSQVCAACHGRDGRGDGPGAAELDPRPRNFSAGLYRVRCTASGEAPRRSDVEGVVRRGMPGSAMPGFEGVLSENEIENIVDFILTLGPLTLAGGEPEALPIPEFPAYDSSRLSEGRAVFLILGCWKCHGLEGTGNGPSAKGLKSDEGRPIRPRDFRHDPFKRGRSLETVARTVLSGFIGTPMTSFAEILVIPRESIDAYAKSIPRKARPDLSCFHRTAPSAAELQALEDDAWLELRDENLTSLAHYVLSLSHRRGLGYRIFRQQPELEGRQRPGTPEETR